MLSQQPGLTESPERSNIRFDMDEEDLGESHEDATLPPSAQLPSGRATSNHKLGRKPTGCDARAKPDAGTKRGVTRACATADGCIAGPL
jgi:hypothetical protein